MIGGQVSGGRSGARSEFGDLIAVWSATEKIVTCLRCHWR